MTTTGFRLAHDGRVLVGVKAKHSGWPTASPDPDSGRDPEATTRKPDPCGKVRTPKSRLHGSLENEPQLTCSRVTRYPRAWSC